MSTETATIFEQPLGFLDLSTRAYSALTNRNLRTVGELVRKTRAELVKTVHNFGTVSCDGVEVQLKKHHLRLGMSDQTMFDYLDARGGNLSLNLSIEVLTVVKTRQQNVLRVQGINTIGDLVSRSKQDLRDIDGISHDTVENIIEALKKRNLVLKPPPSPEMKEKMAARLERALDLHVKGVRSGLTPLFPHDCKFCQPIGQAVEHDLYLCTQGGKLPTLVARYGSNLHEYASGPTLLLFLADKPVLRIAIPKEAS